MLRKKEGFDGQRAVLVPKKILIQNCQNDPVIGGLYITDIGYYPKARFHYRERLNGVDQHILIYCVEGKGWMKWEKEDYDITSGNFVIIPSGSKHCYAADENNPWTIYWVHFKGDISKHLINLMINQLDGHLGYLKYNEARIKLFEELYINLERGYSSENFNYVNICFWHFLNSFIFDEKFNYSVNKRSSDVVDRSIDFMQKMLHTALTLQDIAESINLSASHYSSVFRKKTGFAPVEYFNHLKIQKACQYLLFTDMRIKEIAWQLGIEDQYYFSRMFSKLMGTSPNEYRVKGTQ